MKKITSFIASNPIYLILGLAAIVRVAYLIGYSGLPEWSQFTVDTGFHHRWALSIADGNILGDDVYIRGPLYIYILGLLYSIFGSSIIVGKILGMVIGLATVFVIYKLVIRLFGKTAAVIASILYALYPIVIYFESELLVDSFFTFLLTLSVLVLLRAVETRTIKTAILAGFVLGLAVITRPIALGIIPLFAGYYFYSLWDAGEKWSNSLVYLLSILAVIVPITIRNYIVAGEPVLVAASGGVNFYIGNNPTADGLTAEFPPMGSNWEMTDVKKMAENKVGQELNWSETSDYWYDQSFEWIGSNFGDFVSLYIKKLYHFINNYEISNNRFISSFINGFVIMKYNPLSFGIILMTSVWGIVVLLSTGQWRKEEMLLVCILLAYVLIVSLFFVNSRFRLPIIPLLILIGAAGVEYTRQIKSYKKLILPALISIVAGMFSFGNLYGIDKDTNLASYFSTANNYLKQGDYKEAIQGYRKIVERKSDFPGANLNLGVAYSITRRPDSALKYLDTELRYFPKSAEAFSAKSAHYLAYQNINLALEYGNQAIVVEPENYPLHLPYVRALGLARDSLGLNGLIGYYEEPGKLPPYINLEIGNSSLAMNLFDIAETCYRDVLTSSEQPIETSEWTVGSMMAPYGSLEKMKSRAALEIGYIFGVQNRLDSAIFYNRRAIEFDSENINAYVNLINVLVITGDRTTALGLINEAIVKFDGSNEIFIRMKNSL